MISGLFFILTRMLEVITLIPIVGMLAYFVHLYVKVNALTPTDILVLFIVSVLALAWALATLLLYFSARHSAHIVAAFDLCFVGAFIAGVYLLRGPGTTNCGHFDFYINDNGTGFSFTDNKYCSMLKACFALGIIECILFFWSFVSPSSSTLIVLITDRYFQLMALLVARNHEDRVVVERTYTSSRSHRRSPRGSYDYGRRSGGGSRAGSRSSRTRRSYYV